MNKISTTPPAQLTSGPSAAAWMQAVVYAVRLQQVRRRAPYCRKSVECHLFEISFGSRLPPISATSEQRCSCSGARPYCEMSTRPLQGHRDTPLYQRVAAAMGSSSIVQAPHHQSKQHCRSAARGHALCGGAKQQPAPPALSDVAMPAEDAQQEPVTVGSGILQHSQHVTRKDVTKTHIHMTNVCGPST
jgi:hypothetical protein